jgi:excisionase family DNA binding protein
MNDEMVWLRTPDAAAYLGVHEETIRRWAREGAIPAAKLGNRGGFRFKRADLDKFLERRRAEEVEIG